MESTNGKMNMHFETIANNQSCNAVLRARISRPQTHKARLAASCLTTALKPSRPDSPPPASRRPKDAIRTDATSAESIQPHDATERETKKPRHQVAHGEHALTHHTSPSKENLARPANWDSMSRTAKKNWKSMQARKRGTKHS
jgi:hypothetical protein